MHTWTVTYNSTAIEPDTITADELMLTELGYALKDADGEAVWSAPVGMVANVKRADVVAAVSA